MKVLSKSICLLIISIALFLTGCATNRGIVKIDLPQASVVNLNGKKVFIESVTDKRIFENNPKSQDIPSLGFGGTAQATESIKKRAIARKRNSFGKAMGDILLDEGQTIESVIRESLITSFTELGYKVVDRKDVGSEDIIIVNATIEKFWAYMTPGFWAITLTSEISTNLSIETLTDNGEKIEEITVKSENKYQIATEKNWMEIIHVSVKKYIEKVKFFFMEKK
ncbi:MAG: hypothetical protein K8S18_18235 [Desulfobacula sp.]|nr:hypothetical protein [Desulfobacula sp.]MCK5164614.1 hypothetical protein [Desulfobacula sp.]